MGPTSLCRFLTQEPGFVPVGRSIIAAEGVFTLDLSFILCFPQKSGRDIMVR